MYVLYNEEKLITGIWFQKPKDSIHYIEVDDSLFDEVDAARDKFKLTPDLKLPSNLNELITKDRLLELCSSVRNQRDILLIKLDKVLSNPLRWKELSLEQQESLSLYRQALLDIPQQRGFPTDIAWPDKPEL